MRLRLRLAVTVVAATVPTIVALVWLDAESRHRAAEERLTYFALGHMLNGGERERCEADPASWGGVPLMPPPDRSRREPPPDRPEREPPPDRPRREPPPDRPGREPPRRGPPGAPPGDPQGPQAAPPVLFAYDERLQPQSPRAPAIDASLAARLEGQGVATRSPLWRGSEVEILVRMPWGAGPCAFVLARGTTVPGWIGSILPASRLWLAPIAVIFAAVLLAMGPVIRRIRLLTEAVRRSAAAGFTGAVSVGGRDEIAELGRAFEAAGRAIRAELAEKDRREQALRDFLANTTHDVMIPLTVLKAHLATLEERAASGEPFDRTSLISAMDEAHYIASLLHNLAIAAKLDAGEPSLQRGAVDLNALVGRVMGRHRPIAQKLDVALESAVPEAPLAVDADVTLLEQAVSNIVYNAIRYNRPGGHVAVMVEPAPSSAPDRFRLRVLDDGPGIPAADLSRLVERGFRGSDARTRAPDGKGLGLHIAFRVAELHGLALTLGPSEYGGLQVDLEGPLLPG